MSLKEKIIAIAAVALVSIFLVFYKKKLPYHYKIFYKKIESSENLVRGISNFKSNVEANFYVKDNKLYSKQYPIGIIKIETLIDDDIVSLDSIKKIK